MQDFYSCPIYAKIIPYFVISTLKPSEKVDMYGKLCAIKPVVLPDAYGFVVKTHHIISDAWTLSMVASHFYSLTHGEMPEAFSYEGYLTREDTYIQSPSFIKDREYFLEQFANDGEIAYLSSKFTNNIYAKRKSFIINKNEAAIINSYIKSISSSAFALFITLLAVYISRTHPEMNKFYIGTAVLNRFGVKEKKTMGMFINSVPLLLSVDKEKTFSENINLVQDKTFGAFRHQKCHYADILANLRKEYDLTEKLYDVTFSYQNATVAGSASGSSDNFETVWHHNGVQVESLQVHVDDRDNDGVFRIHFDYQTEKFTEHDMEIMYERMINLLFDAIRHNDKKVFELEILSPEEKNRVLHDFNDTSIAYPHDKCIHTLFEGQALKTPEKTAVIACDARLSYEQLNQAANRIAHNLIAQGISIGDIVSFALPRDSRLIAAIFGILKSGAAYLPIDPDYPQERIEYILKDSNAKMFITENIIDKLLENDNFHNPCLPIKSTELCYCIYTSGTTGDPKGTLISHYNLVNFCSHNIFNKYCNSIDTGLKLLSTFKPSFDAFNVDYALSLTNGHTIILTKAIYVNNPQYLANLINTEKIDIVHTTPTIISMMCLSDEYYKSIAKVKIIIMGGEILTPNIYERLPINNNLVVLNGYGPTETTIAVSYGIVNDKDDITIGKPIANTQIYIVDQFMRLMPIGYIGELCIAGDCVGAGYLNQPELIKEKFIDNPFGPGKLYKSGDLACWDQDGNLHYAGRKDFQVKVRGLRIELGEIEHAISALAGIDKAVVIVRSDSTGRQMLCAFYTGEEKDVRELRASLGKQLPQYMVPHTFTHLPQLPLTANGKLDRNALPEVDFAEIGNMTEYLAPETEQEKALASSVSAVLDIKRISMMDNFFDLGGDSLKGIELILQLEKAGYKTNVKTVFASATLKDLASQLQPATQSFETEAVTGDIPATPAQLRVYIAQGRLGNSTMYNVPCLLQIRNLNPEKLEEAVRTLIDRHEMLRARFENRDGAIMQIVENTVPFSLEQIVDGDIESFIRPFDLSKAPLLRAGYCQDKVLIDAHHIINDGISLQVLLRELNETYMGRPLPEVEATYRQFALQNTYAKEDEDYWLEIYQGDLPILELNTDFKRGQQRSFNGTAIYDSIDIALHNKIIELCRKLNITPHVFYMAAFSIMLSKFSGNEDMVIGLPISGREGRFLDVIGMFVNTVSMRCKPIGIKSVKTFLDEIKEASIGAISHQAYPYGELVKNLDANSLDRNPLFDVMFAYQGDVAGDILFGDEPATLLPVPITTSKYDFTFTIMPENEKVTLMVEYCTDLYHEDTIKRFIAGYKLVLSQLFGIDALLRDISVINEDEKQRLMTDFNNTAAAYPKNKLIHNLFDEQVARTPDKTALVACDATLTYAQLNEQANRVAQGLIANGVKTGDIVAIILPRKSFLIAAILGVMKAGAAFMLIAPDYPEDRINYMLGESNASYRIDENNIQQLLAYPALPLDVPTDNVDIFCVLHTSGSTGQPKLLLLRHKGMVNFCYAHKVFYDKADTAISTTIITFDAFFMETVCPLIHGLKIILASENDIYNQTKFELLFDHSSRNFLFATPTKLESYLHNSIYKNFVKKVTKLVIGGEIFNNNILGRIRKYNNDINIYNDFGPAETTIAISFDDLGKGNDVTIGKPIANTQIYILDQYMNIVPAGVTGELCIAGDSVGAGYINLPELNKEKFIPNPFGGGVLYRSGDLAYWREDGKIVYVGRKDFQVKVRGLRIELGEIENAICAVDGVLQAGVVVRKNDSGRQLICAFYTAMDNVIETQIRTSLMKKLPRYMIPHYFIKLNDMPLTSTGKIDRKKLPEIDWNATGSASGYIEPKGMLEKQLIQIMEDVLEYAPLGAYDSFFEFGGDSLKAIEFICSSHINGVYIELQNIFDYPTARELAKFIERGNSDQNSYADTDFSLIDDILANNSIERIILPAKSDVGNILLTGATGYLGSHILADFLDHDRGLAYCLVRGQDENDSRQRLNDVVEFYFGSRYHDTNRVIAICGDLSKDNFGLSPDEYAQLLSKTDTVINAAASVKHFGSYRYFYETNVDSVQKLINFCLEANAKLIHLSTLSVSGNNLADNFDRYVSDIEKHFYESTLYMGQSLANVYARSKFEAELCVLDAIATKGLRANIMRMGNLTNRLSDGKFQINHATNAFLNRVKGVLELGVFPDYLLDLYAEFTPIDEAAHAVMTIVRHFNTVHTVFHVNSTKVIYLDKLINYFNNLGYNISIVDSHEFITKLRDSAEQQGKKFIFEAFINDMNDKDKLNYDTNIRIENDFTAKYLQWLGFEWRELGLEYLQKYIAYFKGIGYFA